jgi:hypothetical protein
VAPRAGLDDVEKEKFLALLGLELRPLCRPARSQSLYRLRYPGFSFKIFYRHKLKRRRCQECQPERRIVCDREQTKCPVLKADTEVFRSGQC